MSNEIITIEQDVYAMQPDSLPRFYTYFHTRNDSGAIFYVGKGIGRRAYATRRNNPHWQSVVKRHGHQVHIATYWPTNEEALEHEKFLISCLREIGCELTNLTDGGEGTVGRRLSEEAKRRISIANTGVKRSPEWIANMKAHVTGRVFTKEHRDRLSKSTVGRKKPQAEIDGYLPALRSAMAKPEVHAKISASAKGRFVSEETRAKMAAAQTGRKASEATKAKMSLATKTWRAKLSQQEGAL